MPTYEYRCTECGLEFEEFQKMSDPPVETCPKCFGKVERIISGGTGLIFKGSGFYITDYKHKDGNGGDSHNNHKHQHSHAHSEPSTKSDGGASDSTPKPETPKKESPKDSGAAKSES